MYTVTQGIMGKLQVKVLQTLEQAAKETWTEEYREDELEEIWCQRVIRAPNIKTAVDELQDVLEQACLPSLTQTRTTGKALRHKPTPWWTSSLTTQRKEVNAKRRRHQRTKVNSEIWGDRKEQYLAAKAEYTAAIRREKVNYGKNFVI